MNEGNGGLVLIGILYLVGLAIYMLPAWVAFRRQHPNRWIILAVNVTFGATGIGWLGCLAWALYRAHLPANPTQSRGGQSGLNLFVNDPRQVQLVGPGRAAAHPRSGDTAWAVAEIERLARLHAAGHLTDDEHRRLKADVLAAVV